MPHCINSYYRLIKPSSACLLETSICPFTVCILSSVNSLLPTSNQKGSSKYCHIQQYNTLSFWLTIFRLVNLLFLCPSVSPSIYLVVYALTSLFKGKVHWKGTWGDFRFFLLWPPWFSQESLHASSHVSCWDMSSYWWLWSSLVFLILHWAKFSRWITHSSVCAFVSTMLCLYNSQHLCTLCDGVLMSLPLDDPMLSKVWSMCICRCQLHIHAQYGKLKTGFLL